MPRSPADMPGPEAKKRLMARQDAIRERLAEYGISQSDLARALWVTPSYVSAQLKGRTNTAHLDKLEAALEELIQAQKAATKRFVPKQAE